MGIDGVEKGPRIEIQTPMPGDAKMIQHLIHASVLATYRNDERGVNEEYLEAVYKEEFSPEGLEEFKKELADPQEEISYFVAKDDDIIVGYCDVLRLPGKNVLRRLHVLPERTGERIGLLLWNKALAVLDPQKDTELWVVNYNDRAIHTYQTWGFELTEESRPRDAKRTQLKMVLKAGHEQTA